MEKSAEAKNPPPGERRRFLRESLTGSVPLLLSWVAGQARLLSNLLQPPPSPPKTSPPPVVSDTAPAPVKQSLDEHYQQFARDNPSGEALRVNPDSDPTAS